MESGAHFAQLIYTATNALTTPPPGTSRGLVNSLYQKEPARTPRKGVKTKCSWREGASANAKKTKINNLTTGVEWPYRDCDWD